MDASDVLEFWFGDRDDQAAVIRQRSALWWGKGDALDADIRQRFAALTQQALAGELTAWTHAPANLLALVIVCDQFPRNMYRGTPAAFAGDPLAHELVLQALAAGWDQQLSPIERVFLYMPLEHAEDLASQQRCVKLNQALCDEVDPALRESFQNFVKFAQQHLEIIARFGRFPHRNAILGRQSSPEEAEFLQQPNSSF